MKFHIKKLTLPAAIVLQSVLFLAFFLWVMKNSADTTKLINTTNCDFFVNIVEWQAGSEETFSPDLSVQTQAGALRIYNRQVAEEIGLCREGMCLDSAKVILYRSCPEGTDVVALKDTTIHF